MAPPKTRQSSMDSFLRATTKSPDPNAEPKPESATDYDQIRLETIRRNQDFLQKLGILNKSSSSSSSKSAPTNSNRPKLKKLQPPPPSIPLRRSARNHSVAPPVPPPSSDADCNLFRTNDSSVFHYACDSTRISSAVPVNPSGPTLSFEIIGDALRSPSLSKIYAMDVFSFDGGRFLISAGGHGGAISVFGGEEQKGGGGPLMSWKGSRSWISGVMFLEDNPMLLLSTSNDGKIVVWDIKKSSGGIGLPPPMVVESEGMHTDGIFAMDRRDCWVATASKDSSVGICRLTTDGKLVADRSNVTGHHSGAIRGVRFSNDKDKIADCGADGIICIIDTRLPEPCALTIESQHSTGVNTIEWSNTNKFLLLSASKDASLLLYDMRSSREPIHKLEGHVESNLKTCYNIYRPAFVDGGKGVATPGQGSKKLTLSSVDTGASSVDTGALVSKGMIGYDANLVMFTSTDANNPRLWAAGKQINQLRLS